MSTAHPVTKLILESLVPTSPKGYDVDPKKRSLIMSQLNAPTAGAADITAFYETVGHLARTNGKQAANTLLTLAMEAIDVAPKTRAAGGWGARR